MNCTSESLRRAGRMLLMVCTAGWCCPMAWAADLDLTIAQDVSTGRYGEASPTRIEQRTVMVKWRAGPHTAEVQVPHLTVAAGGSAAGLPDLEAGGEPKVSGLGDVWLRFGTELVDAGATRPSLDLVLRHKLATGSRTQGLGSGARDWALQIEAQQVLGTGHLFAVVGHRWTGDVPGFRAYRNPWFGDLGWQWRPAPAQRASLMLTAREPIGRLGSLAELTGAWHWQVEGHRLGLSVSAGLSRAAPDVGVGVSWRTRWSW